jgi:hypothetical protein
MAIGLHSSYNKTKKINSGIFFSAKILTDIYNWIWEMETPIFNILMINNNNTEAITSKKFVYE